MCQICCFKKVIYYTYNLKFFLIDRFVARSQEADHQPVAVVRKADDRGRPEWSQRPFSDVLEPDHYVSPSQVSRASSKGTPSCDGSHLDVEFFIPLQL